jgi:hypothetical protein
MKRRRHIPTAQELFDWAAGWTERAAKSGNPEQYPTIRKAARRFCCKQAEIAEVLDGDIALDDGYLGMGVGWRVGNGVADIEKVGDYIVEAYRTHENEAVLDTPEIVVERIDRILAKPRVSLYAMTLREWRLVKMLIDGRKE